MIITAERIKLHQTIDTLPDDLLMELAQFVAFLQFKDNHGHRQSFDTTTPHLTEDEVQVDMAYNPVYLPIIVNDSTTDISLDDFKKLRRAMWATVGEKICVE